MLENLMNKPFEYKKLTAEEQQKRGILGRLVGVIADTQNPTRNGRKYSEQLWENVFENPIMKEKIANRCCFGELNHPADRTDTDIEKVAICLAEVPKKNKKGQLCGVFDILNTPNGKILKALCDYGCKIGISSRGQGDIVEGVDGEEVDPDTYECECFDAVLVPGVESARLSYVTEGLDTNKTLKAALLESYKSSTEDEKKIMKETLEDLKLNINEKVDEEEVEETEVEETEEDTTDVDDTEAEVEDKEEDEDETEEECEDDEEDESEDNEASDEEIFLNFLANNFDTEAVKAACKVLNIDIVDDENDELKLDINTSPEDLDDEDTSDEVTDIEIEDTSDDESEDAEEDDNDAEEANDDGSDDLIENLKEALRVKSQLEEAIKDLQNKLAVSDTKVNEAKEECNRQKSAIARLSTIAKSQKDLKEQFAALKKELDDKDQLVESYKTRIARLVKGRKEAVENSQKLSESLEAKSKYINTLTKQINELKASKNDDSKQLNEDLNKVKNESATKISKLTEDLNKATTIKESYRKLANTAVNKYIEVKADMLGLTTKDIKRKLGESYTLEDVDTVCEDLKTYQLNVSKLPFSLDKNKKITVKVNEAKNSRINNAESNDDDVDSGLIKLANLD